MQNHNICSLLHCIYTILHDVVYRRLLIANNNNVNVNVNVNVYVYVNERTKE